MCEALEEFGNGEFEHPQAVRGRLVKFSHRRQKAGCAEWGFWGESKIKMER